MAVHGKEPFIKVLDSNGDPIVGAILKVYEAGTTTYRNIYSDTSLSIALPNPLTGVNASNASGDFPRFYMAAGSYKLRAETSGGVLIWEFDNIDTGLSAGAGALPISAGGTGATTAAAARASLDVPSNSELADLAADIADLSSSVQNIVSFPQGRLTLTTGTPVLTTGVSAATAVYYSQYVGNIVPVYDGTQFNARTFTSDLTLTLNSNHVANGIYDVFIYWDGTDLQIATGVAWNTATAGSGARGSGAGTTELVRVNGLWVNKYDVASRNGATTGTITANQGTYIGSIAMDGTNGQVSCHTAYGQSRRWGVWNAYNRLPIIVKAGDATAGWTIGGGGSGAFRSLNGTSTNSITTFTGLPEQAYEFSTHMRGSYGTSTNGIEQFYTGVGYNSTSSASGFVGTHGVSFGGTVVGNFTFTHVAEGRYDLLSGSIGINVVTHLEAYTANSTAPSVVAGGETSNLLVAKWEG